MQRVKAELDRHFGVQCHAGIPVLAMQVINAIEKKANVGT